MTNTPVLSVCMITYNHEKYIEQAIKSVLLQKVDFDVEFIICNDASTDTTHEIITGFGEKINKFTIKYFNQSKNLGMIPNFLFALKSCSGKYIALCEGDDYWIDPLKLKKQIDFLEKNPGYNLVTGYTRQYIQDKDRFISPKKTPDYSFTYKDMIVKNHCRTCTTMIRNFIKSENSFQLIEDMGTDSQLWIRALGPDGKGKCLNSVLAVYRRHDLGMSNIFKTRRNSYRKKIDSMNRKIKKANFWNQYYGGKAKSSALLVKKKMYKRMLKMAISNYRLWDIPLYSFRYIKSSLSI